MLEPHSIALVERHVEIMWFLTDLCWFYGRMRRVDESSAPSLCGVSAR
jgi:hypothetical protein